MTIKIIKNEKGSITLFVLIAMLFFLIVVFSVFISSSNKMQAQTSEIDKIQEEYDKDIDEIYNQVYDQLIQERTAIKIGDYIDYHPEDAGDYLLSSRYSGYSSDQTISQEENLVWRVLDIHEDGTVDIISTQPVNELYLGGGLGYNNGVYILNDICQKLYSNSQLNIDARSMTIGDIEDRLNTAGQEDKNNQLTGATNTYIGDSAYYPSLYAKENGAGIDTEQVQTNALDISDDGITELTSDTITKAENFLVATLRIYMIKDKPEYFDNPLIYEMIFGTGGNYWLASRCVGLYSEEAWFGLSDIRSTELNVIGLRSSKFTITDTVKPSGIRPIVTIGTNVKIIPCIGENGPDNMHTIENN